MNERVKKYIKVSATLGLIAGISALLVGLANAITADRILQNAAKKEANGLKEVYDNADAFSPIDVASDATYVVKIWSALDQGGQEVGYIYKTSGRNAYGTVTMLLGISGEAILGRIVLLENTETYGQTLEDNYVTPYNAEGADTAKAIDDVRCGATYGAKLIQSMAKEAQADYQARKEGK